jgi:hypothetical protein
VRLVDLDVEKMGERAWKDEREGKWEEGGSQRGMFFRSNGRHTGVPPLNRYTVQIVQRANPTVV